MGIRGGTPGPPPNSLGTPSGRGLVSVSHVSLTSPPSSVRWRSLGPAPRGEAAAVDQVQLERRRQRYRRLDGLRRISASKRLRECGTRVVGTTVEVKRSEGGRAHFAGLRRCGLVWTCPVCAPKIRQARADEIAQALRTAEARGLSVAFLTLTTGHRAGQRLAGLYGASEAAWGSVRQAKRWRDLMAQLGFVGSVQAREITYGAHGWHPHRHMALVFRCELGERERQLLESTAWELWDSRLRTRGLWSSRAVGAVVRLCGPGRADGLGAYLTDVAGEKRSAISIEGLSLELARGDLKVSPRSVEGVVDRGQEDGEAEAARLWLEYEASTKGRQMITWSKGLRDELLGGAVETTDQEEAERDVGGEVLAVLDVEAWKLVRRAGPVDCLEAAERGPEALRAWLAAAGVG